jgi:hypothetical protein
MIATPANQSAKNNNSPSEIEFRRRSRAVISAQRQFYATENPSEGDLLRLVEAETDYLETLSKYKNGLILRDIYSRNFLTDVALAFVFGGETPLFPGKAPFIFPSWPASCRRMVNDFLKSYGYEYRDPARSLGPNALQCALAE